MRVRRGMRALAYLYLLLIPSPTLSHHLPGSGPSTRSPRHAPPSLSLSLSLPRPADPSSSRGHCNLFFVALPRRAAPFRYALPCTRHTTRLISFGDVMSYTTLNTRCICECIARAYPRMCVLVKEKKNWKARRYVSVFVRTFMCITSRRDFGYLNKRFPILPHTFCLYFKYL